MGRKAQPTHLWESVQNVFLIVAKNKSIGARMKVHGLLVLSGSINVRMKFLSILNKSRECLYAILQWKRTVFIAINVQVDQCILSQCLACIR